eukprot:UN32894
MDKSTDSWYDIHETEMHITSNKENILVCDESQTEAWLKEIGVGHLAMIFIQNGYAGWKLKFMSDLDLLHMGVTKSDITKLLEERDIELARHEIEPPEGVGFMPLVFSFLEDSACELDVPVDIPEGATHYNDKVREQVALRSMMVFTTVFLVFSIMAFIFNSFRGNYTWKGYTSNIMTTLILILGIFGGQQRQSDDPENKPKSRALKLQLLQLYFLGMFIIWVFGCLTGIYYLTKVEDKIEDWCDRDDEDQCDRDNMKGYKRMGYVMAVSCIFTFFFTILHVLRIIARSVERVLKV